MPRRLATAACLAGALIAVAPAEGAPAPITGEVSSRGATVIAVGENGVGTASRASRTGRRFSIRPSAGRVTLHVRGRDGVYRGPVVVGRSKDGSRAYLGVKAGARLGLIRIDARRGLATPRSKPAARHVDRRRWARARRGVPIGAGKFGLVRSAIPRPSPPGDLDADGIADPFDIDDNGNRVLDRYERRAGARGAADVETLTLYVVVLGVDDNGSVRGRVCENDVVATATWPSAAPAPQVGQAYRVEVDSRDPVNTKVLSASAPLGQGCPPIAFRPNVSPTLLLTLRDTVNANAAALTSARLDETLAQRGAMLFKAAGRPGLRIELDCGGAADPSAPRGWSGGLPYCTKGGTGRAIRGIVPGSPPRSWPIAFPDGVDADRNGFAELGGLAGGPTTCASPCVESFFSPGATPGQIGTGDVLNWRVTVDGTTSQLPTVLPDVFATVPALISARDGTGTTTTVRYPVAAPFVGSGADYLGAPAGPYQGFPVDVCPVGAPAPCSAGDVVLTLTLWRPQRRAIPRVEAGDWTDIGGLVYSPGVAGETQPAPANCRPEQLSTRDPNLTGPTPSGSMFHGYGFRDKAPDRRASAANTLTFSLNVTRCLADGVPGSIGPTWDPGESVTLWLSAGVGASPSAGANHATQQLLLTRK